MYVFATGTLESLFTHSLMSPQVSITLNDSDFAPLHVAPNLQLTISFGGPASPHLPWKTEVELARFAFSYLRHEIRCDPGFLASHPQSDEFWFINKQGEGLVVW